MTLKERFRCRHGHTANEHPSCWNRKEGIEEKIAFLDIEASNLNAPFGIIYTIVIKELDGKIYKNSVTIKDLHAAEYDKNLIKWFIEISKKFTRIICHYGTGPRHFDIPMLRSRAVLFNLPFPEYKFLNVSDTHTILKNKFRLHSNRLEAACDFLGIESKAHKLNPGIWLKMITGNKKLMKQALDYIMRHNIEDVISLEKLWKRIYKYTPLSKSSI